jgi:hypothetical protein
MSGSIQLDRPTLPCKTCGAAVTELRRGRCWGCYTQWSETRPVGRGAACAICQERRRQELKLAELHGRTYTFCHSCAGKLMRLEPIPSTLDEMREAIRRERREQDRRSEGVDRRIFPRERRVGERRSPARGNADTDPFIALPDFEELVIELGDQDVEVIDQTTVRER